jgi:hypothetical protein
MQSVPVVAVLGLLFFLGSAGGCAMLPVASDTDHHANAQHTHHSHDHGQAGTSTEHEAPTSFATRPEVGTEFTCPVSGGLFEVEPHTRVSLYEGRYYAMCCGGCAQEFDADPAFFVNKLEKKSAANHESH